MRKHTKFITRTVVLVVAGCFAACNGTIDEEPNVVLEVQTLTVPPVTSAQDSTTGTCTFTITQATGTFKNLPKNALATTSPFNDIILQSVNIAYTWDDGAPAMPRTTGLGGAVPANGTVSSQFSAIASADLAVDGPLDPAGTGRAGHTAALALTFHGQTVSGDAVTAVSGGSLQVNTCTATFGACCLGTSCQILTQPACLAQGGSYKGDGTSCSTSNICLGP